MLTKISNWLKKNSWWINMAMLALIAFSVVQPAAVNVANGIANSVSSALGWNKPAPRRRS